MVQHEAVLAMPRVVFSEGSVPGPRVTLCCSKNKGMEASADASIPQEASSGGFQIESHHFRVWEIERRRRGIGAIRVGPTRKITGAILVPGRAIHQRNAGQLLHHDLLQAVEGLLLQRGVGGGGILSQ